MKRKYEETVALGNVKYRLIVSKYQHFIFYWLSIFSKWPVTINYVKKQPCSENRLISKCSKYVRNRRKCSYFFHM